MIKKYLIFEDSDWENFLNENGFLIDVKSIYDKTIFDKKSHSY